MDDEIFTKIDFAALLKDSKKGSRRSLQLALNTIDLIHEEGLDGFSFEKLSKRSKIARSLIYHYFPTLTSLLMFSSAYIRFEYQSFVLKKIATQKTPLGILSGYVLAALDWVDVSPKHACVWLIYFHRCALTPELASQNRVLVDMGTQRIQGILNAGISMGEFGLTKNDVPRVARAIQVLITGGLISRATESRSAPYWQNEFHQILQTALNMVHPLQSNKS